jgi:hypothetical protein
MDWHNTCHATLHPRSVDTRRLALSLLASS